MRNISTESKTTTSTAGTARIAVGAACAAALLFAYIPAVGAATPDIPTPVVPTDIKIAVTTPTTLPPTTKPTYEIYITDCLDLVNGCDEPEDIDDFAPTPTVPDDDIDDFAPNPTVPDDDIDDLAPNPTVPDGGGDDGDDGENPDGGDDGEDPDTDGEQPDPGNNIDDPRPGNPNFAG